MKNTMATVMVMVCGAVTAGPLSDPVRMADAADRATGGAGIPTLEKPSTPSGLSAAVAPGGAVVTSDVSATAASVKSQGVWATIGQFVSDHPYSIGTGLGSAAALVLKNNPKWIGMDSKDSPSSQANGNSATTTDNSVHVQVSNNPGSTTVIVQSPTTTGGTKQK